MLRAQREFHPIRDLQPVMDGEHLMQTQDAVRRVFVHDSLLHYVQRLVSETRQHPHATFGASPRGALALVRAAQALAAIRRASFVTPDHVKALATPRPRPPDPGEAPLPRAGCRRAASGRGGAAQGRGAGGLRAPVVDEASPWRGFLTATAAIAGLLGFGSGSVALVAFAAGWALVLGLAWLAAHRGLSGLEVHRRLPPSAFEGDLITVDVALENHGGEAARFVLAEDQFGGGADRSAERPRARPPAASAPADALLPRVRGPAVGPLHRGAALDRPVRPAGPVLRQASTGAALPVSRSTLGRRRSRRSRSSGGARPWPRTTPPRPRPGRA